MYFWYSLLLPYWPLVVAQAALTIWLLMDADKRGVDPIWFWLILVFQPLGAWGYFFAYKLQDIRGAGGWMSGLFKSRPSLDALRFKAERSPTPAASLELAERLVEAKLHEEATPHLEAVLKREPEHLASLYMLAGCRCAAKRHADAAELLRKLIALQPNWRDRTAWLALIEACHDAGQHAEATAHARKLAQVEPSLEHACWLARSLARAGDKEEGRRSLAAALEEYRFTPTPSKHDRAWASRAKQLLAEMG